MVRFDVLRRDLIVVLVGGQKGLRDKEFGWRIQYWFVVYLS